MWNNWESGYWPIAAAEPGAALVEEGLEGWPWMGQPALDGRERGREGSGVPLGWFSIRCPNSLNFTCQSYLWCHSHISNKRNSENVKGRNYQSADLLIVLEQGLSSGRIQCQLCQAMVPVKVSVPYPITAYEAPQSINMSQKCNQVNSPCLSRDIKAQIWPKAVVSGWSLEKGQSLPGDSHESKNTMKPSLYCRFTNPKNVREESSFL